MNYKDCATIKARVEYIKTKLASDCEDGRRWRTRALVRLLAEQTADEQASEATSMNNGVGFTSTDAPFATSLAKRVGLNLSLTENQDKAARKMLPKYAGQLERLTRNV